MSDKQIEEFSQLTSPAAADKMLVQKASDSSYRYVELDDLFNSVGIVHDTTPQLGGHLACNGYNLTGLGKLNMGGTAFPTSPVSGDMFYRSDLKMLCVYDGTRWLTAQRFSFGINSLNTSGGANLGCRTLGTYGLYAETVCLSTQVIAPNDASNYWTVIFNARNTTRTATSALQSFNTAADAAGAYVARETTPSTQAPANYGILDITLSKSGSPGNLDLYAALYWRYIIT